MPVDWSTYYRYCDECGREHHQSEGGCSWCYEKVEEQLESMVHAIMSAVILEAASQGASDVWVCVEDRNGDIEEYIVPAETLNRKVIDLSSAENLSIEFIERFED